MSEMAKVHDPAIVLLARATVALEQQVEVSRAILEAVDRLGAALDGAAAAAVATPEEDGAGDVDDILDQLDGDGDSDEE